MTKIENMELWLAWLFIPQPLLPLHSFVTARLTVAFACQSQIYYRLLRLKVSFLVAVQGQLNPIML